MCLHAQCVAVLRASGMTSLSILTGVPRSGGTESSSSLSGVSYKQLQALCKEKGLRAVGTASAMSSSLEKLSKPRKRSTPDDDDDTTPLPTLAQNQHQQQQFERAPQRSSNPNEYVGPMPAAPPGLYQMAPFGGVTAVPQPMTAVPQLMISTGTSAHVGPMPAAPHGAADVAVALGSQAVYNQHYQMAPSGPMPPAPYAPAPWMPYFPGRPPVPYGFYPPQPPQ